MKICLVVWLVVYIVIKICPFGPEFSLQLKKLLEIQSHKQLGTYTLHALKWLNILIHTIHPLVKDQSLFSFFSGQHIQRNYDHLNGRGLTDSICHPTRGAVHALSVGSEFK